MVDSWMFLYHSWARCQNTGATAVPWELCPMVVRIWSYIYNTIYVFTDYMIVNKKRNIVWYVFLGWTYNGFTSAAFKDLVCYPTCHKALWFDLCLVKKKKRGGALPLWVLCLLNPLKYPWIQAMQFVLKY